MFFSFACTHDLGAGRDGLLAKDVQSTVNSLDGLLGVDSGGTRDNNSLQGLLRIQHLLVSLVGADMGPFGLSSIQFSLNRRAHGDELCARSEVGEVTGMAHT